MAQPPGDHRWNGTPFFSRIWRRGKKSRIPLARPCSATTFPPRAVPLIHILVPPMWRSTALPAETATPPPAHSITYGGCPRPDVHRRHGYERAREPPRCHRCNRHACANARGATVNRDGPQVAEHRCGAARRMAPRGREDRLDSLAAPFSCLTLALFFCQTSGR